MTFLADISLISEPLVSRTFMKLAENTSLPLKKCVDLDEKALLVFRVEEDNAAYSNTHSLSKE